MAANEISYDYAEDLAIDPDNLVKEWQQQPGLYMKYATAHADAVLEKDRKWEALKVRRSQLVKEAKENGASNAMQQEAYYRDHEDHKQLKDELAKLEYQVNILQGATVAFSHKRPALENLVKLLLSEFYSAPKSLKTVEGGKLIVDMKVESVTDSARSQRAGLNTKREEREAELTETKRPARKPRSRG